MPAFLTHWCLLIETAHHSQDVGSDLGSLIIDASALRRRAHGWSTPPQTSATGAVWDTGPLPEVDFRFPGSDISALAFLGALAPDIMYYHQQHLRRKLADTYPSRAASPAAPEKALQWSELFHSSHSADILIAFLEQVALVPSPALRSQALAFAMGYVSHIAVDLALNPWIDALAARLPSHHLPGPRAYIELRLDEHLASTYFDHPRYSLFSQPWGGYIDPVARDLSRPGTMVGQLLQLLAIAAEVYQLEEEQTERLSQDFREGLSGLRHFLAGHGRAWGLTLTAALRREQHDVVWQVLANTQSDAVTIALEKVLSFGEQLSTFLCRRAINYYTALRNPNAEASTRSSQRAALVNDLRNWNLYTGYSTDNLSHEQPPLHSWVHFADLWGPPADIQEVLSRHPLSANQA